MSALHARQLAEWASEERKLQPVYEDIQYGRYDAANETVTRWIKKHPKSQPAMVLTMVLAEKQRRGTAAVLEAYEAVKRSGPLTNMSQWFAAMTFRNIRRPDLVVDMFQRLWDASSSNQYADQVFLNAAAMGDTEKMSEVSRKLFNATKAPQWARLAAYSQWVQHAPAPSDDTPFPLAPEKSLLPATLMLKTAGDGGDDDAKGATADALWLRLQVLLGSGDAEGAFALVQREARGGALSRRWAGMEAAKAAAARGVEGAWDDELSATAELLRARGEEAYNYAFYRHILLCLEETGWARAGEAEELFDELSGAMGGKERAPVLAALELDMKRRKAGQNKGGMSETEWEAALRAYLVRWGGKWSAVGEVHGLAEGRETQIKEIMAEIAAKEHTDERSYLARAVAELYLMRHGGGKSVPSDAERYWNLYLAGLEFGKNLPKTDVQPADEMGLAAVNVLVESWQVGPTDETPLLRAAALLEYMISKSPSSFSARFTLVRIYRLLGAPGLYTPHLEKLDFSEIQLDSLAHVITERGGIEARIGAQAKAWSKVGNKGALMYTRSATDLPQYVMQALEHESYSKVHGIRTLIKCLGTSLAARALELETLNLALATGTETMDTTLDALTAAIQNDSPFVDNRNYELMVPALVSGEAPQPTYDEKSIRALAAVTVRVARFVRGDTVPDLAASTDGLSEVDSAYIMALVRVLQRATAPAADADPAEDRPVACDALTDIYNPLLTLVTQPAAPGTRWQRVSAALALGQLARVLDAVGLRIAASTSSAAKKKKKGGAGNSLGAELKTARETLKTRSDEVLKALEESNTKEVWEAVGEGLGGIEGEFADKIRRRVENARAEMVAGVRRLLGGKQL